MITVQAKLIDIDQTHYLSIPQEMPNYTREEVIRMLMNSNTQQPDFICLETKSGVIGIPKNRVKSFELIVNI